MTDRALQRIRTFDPHAVPTGSWLFMGLAVADLIVRATGPSRSFNLFWLPGLVILAAPLVVAAAVIYARPQSRAAYAGGVALGIGELLHLLRVLMDPGRIGANALSDASAYLNDIGLLVTIVGLFAIGVGLRGLRSRVALMALAAGAVVYVVQEVWYLGRLPGILADFQLPVEILIPSFVGPLVTIGWAFVAGVAFDRGMRLIALGAALMVVSAALDTLILMFNLVNPTTDFSLVALLFQAGQWIAWGSLIAGILLELGRPNVGAPEADSTAARNAAEAIPS